MAHPTYGFIYLGASTPAFKHVGGIVFAPTADGWTQRVGVLDDGDLKFDDGRTVPVDRL